MVVIAIPILVSLFLLVHKHYRRIGRLLRIGQLTGDVAASNSFVLLVGDFGPATIDAVSYLFTIRCQQLTALWVGPEDGLDAARETWRRVAPRYGELAMLPGDRSTRCAPCVASSSSGPRRRTSSRW